LLLELSSVSFLLNMAVVFLNNTTEKPRSSTRDHCASNNRKTGAEEFLSRKGWNCIRNQGFYSQPSQGSAKDQFLAQAKALQDIENLLKWKPSLKECLKDSVIIVGQVYDIESLIANTSSDTHKNKKEPQGRQSLFLDLESSRELPCTDHCAQDETTKDKSITNSIENTKIGQVKVRRSESSKTGTRPGVTRQPRLRQMGSASKVTSRPIVNFRKKPVKTTNSKNTTSMLLPGRSPSDINSNHLPEEDLEHKESNDDDITPLYLTCLEEEDASEVKMGVCACGKNSYHVETFVKGESCAKNLCCANINVDPSERVVV